MSVRKRIFDLTLNEVIQTLRDSDITPVQWYHMNHLLNPESDESDWVIYVNIPDCKPLLVCKVQHYLRFSCIFNGCGCSPTIRGMRKLYPKHRVKFSLKTAPKLSFYERDTIDVDILVDSLKATETLLRKYKQFITV